MKDGTRLIYAPILHAQEGPRHTASIKPENGRPREDRGKRASDRSALDEMWEGIAAKIEGLNLPWHQTRIYQDAVPVCGNELELVTRLASSGCRSSLFTLNLINRGATLEGTEDMDLLIQEYDLLNNLLMKHSEKSQKVANTEYQMKSRALLTLRDQFILNRITSTLQKEELPLVFMSVMHRLDKMLEQQYSVSYVIYRLPFRSIGAIYNA